MKEEHCHEMLPTAFLDILFFEGSRLLMMTLGMLWHLGPPLARRRVMKISPFTFQTEFSLALDHSANPPTPLPHKSCRENTNHQNGSLRGQSLSPGNHCGNTW